MIKYIFTKIVQLAMLMDFITYKTRMRKKKNKKYGVTPQQWRSTYKCHKCCLFQVSKALLQLNDFQNIWQQSIHFYQTIKMTTYDLILFVWQKSLSNFRSCLTRLFLTRHGVFIQSIKLPEINPLFLFSWNLSNARMSPYNIFFINSVVHHQFRSVGNHYFNCRMK